MRRLPNSQKAMHVLGSAPLKASLNRSRYILQDEEGDPGKGIAILQWLSVDICDTHHVYVAPGGSSRNNDPMLKEDAEVAST